MTSDTSVALGSWYMPKDGEWFPRPQGRRWRCKCCECGKVDVFELRRVKRGGVHRIEMRGWREEDAPK